MPRRPGGGAGARRISVRLLQGASATGCGSQRTRRQNQEWGASRHLSRRSGRPTVARYRWLVADDGAEDDRARSGARCGCEKHAARRRRSKRADGTPDKPGAPDGRRQEKEKDRRCPRAGPAYLAVQLRKREDHPSAHGASRDAQDGGDLAVRPPFEKRHVKHLSLACGERSKACLNRVAAQGGEQTIPDAGFVRRPTSVFGQESSCLGVVPKPPSRVGWHAVGRALTFDLDHAAHSDLTVDLRLPWRKRLLIVANPRFPAPAGSRPPPTRSGRGAAEAAFCSTGKCGRCRHRSARHSWDTRSVGPPEWLRPAGG